MDCTWLVNSMCIIFKTNIIATHTVQLSLIVTSEKQPASLQGRQTHKLDLTNERSDSIKIVNLQCTV